MKTITFPHPHPPLLLRRLGTCYHVKARNVRPSTDTGLQENRLLGTRSETKVALPRLGDGEPGPGSVLACRWRSGVGTVARSR